MIELFEYTYSSLCLYFLLSIGTKYHTWHTSDGIVMMTHLVYPLLMVEEIGYRNSAC